MNFGTENLHMMPFSNYAFREKRKWKPYFTQGRKYIYIRTFHVYHQTSAILVTWTQLFRKNRRTEDHTFLTGINEIIFMR